MYISNRMACELQYSLILLQGNYVLPWQNASLQNYPGPPGGSQFSGQPSRNYNNNQPRLPALPEPREDGRYQDPADLFRQFADQQDGGGDPNAGVANSNTNSANNRNSNSANSNATITVSGTTRRTTAR
jgi:hypothetical protein